MKNLRVLCRVVTYDPKNMSILLVRNENQNWWCLPGGGWDHNQETILECASRETLEETGIQVKIMKLLYTQTLYLEGEGNTWLEHFWLAEPIESTEIPLGHNDMHGVVDEARWFTKGDIQKITVYPEVFKTIFWDIIKLVINEPDRYLGHFIL